MTFCHLQYRCAEVSSPEHEIKILLAKPAISNEMGRGGGEGMGLTQASGEVKH